MKLRDEPLRRQGRLSACVSVEFFLEFIRGLYHQEGGVW